MALTIRKKLLIGYGIGVLLVATVGSIAIYDRYLLTESIEEMRIVAEEIDSLHDLHIAIGRMLVSLNNYIVTGDAAEKAEYKNRKKEVKRAFSRLKDLVESMGEGTMEEKLLLLKGMEGRLLLIYETAEAILSTAGNDPAGMRLMRDMDRIKEEMIDLSMRYAAVDKGKLRSVINRSINSIHRVDLSMISGSLIVFAFALFYIVYLDRTIRKPIEEFTEGVKKVAAGKWSRVDVEDGVEINILTDEFNRLLERLEKTYSALESKVEERTAELKRANKELGKQLKEVRKLQRLAEELAIKDGLTGLFNYRYFWQRLEEEILRARRFHHPVSLIIADIDYFKLYNDLHGHLLGDALLRGVAEVLQGNVRTIDVVARYGGEEFVIILVQTGKEEALNVAEKLRKAVEEKTFPFQESQPGGNLTMSFGVATFPMDAKDPDGLIKRADDALYRAKEEGKNRVFAA